MESYALDDKIGRIGLKNKFATNVFAREQDGWRMVHHQAGPGGQRQPAPPKSERPPGTLH